MSMGRGKTMVEFFSAEIVFRVWKRGKTIPYFTKGIVLESISTVVE